MPDPIITGKAILFLSKLKWIQKLFKRYWIGILIGIIFTLILFLIFLGGDFMNLYSYGKKMASFRIKKGHTRTIVHGELAIKFWEVNYMIDSTFVYPAIVAYPGEKAMEYLIFENVDENPIITIPSEDYYYTINVRNISESSKDTLMLIDVYWKKTGD